MRKFTALKENKRESKAKTFECVIRLVSITLFVFLLGCLTAAQGKCAEDPNRDLNGHWYTTDNPFKNDRGQCTWYAWGRAAELGWKITFDIDHDRNAYKWYSHVNNAASKNLDPNVGDIMCLESSNNIPDGHVAYVVQVNSSTSWVVEEYNVDTLAWTREPITRSSSNSTSITGSKIGTKTLQGFLHPPVIASDANDLYVDGNGSNGTDSASGTQDHPLKTVKWAVTIASSAKTVAIHIKGAHYSGKVNIKSKKIKLINNGGGTVRIGN